MQAKRCLELKVTFAGPQDLPKIKLLADMHRHEIGFVNKATLAEAIENDEVLHVHQGFLHFHHRRDVISTLYHLCVDPKNRKQGIGRKLIEIWEEHSVNCERYVLRLKCPIDLDANGFYRKMGFRQVAIEEGKKRSLIVWEKKLRSGGTHPEGNRPKSPRFIASLSMGGGDLRRLREWWNRGGDRRNPFEYVIYSPIACPKSTTDYLRKQKEIYSSTEGIGTKEVWLDCGAYQVQQGKYTYDELLLFLEKFYTENQWADGYVLPDIVPVSIDPDEVVENKVTETLFHCQKFYESMTDRVQQRVIAPVHGRNVEQINRCIETYAQIGIKKIGFGSWGTSGRDGSSDSDYGQAGYRNDKSRI
jgi:GNAT superfamily N-acetyltransferase